MKRRLYLAALAILAGFSLTGCATVSAPRDDVPRLLAHPQATAAAKAAPDFFTEAMNTVARLDHELNTHP